MEPLVQSMMNEDPASRPTMHEVLEAFKAILPKLSRWQLRARLVDRKDDDLVNALKDVHFLYCRMIPYILLLLPPMPTPKS